MSEPDLVVRGRRVVTPNGERAAAIHVQGGRIVLVSSYDHVPPAAELIDAENGVVLPGLLDTHVHVNEPGRTEWEGFATATRAAAAGGVTTIVDMPLNSVPPTTTTLGLEAKRAAAEGRCFVDVGFWGGAVPDNLGALADLHAAGVFGFKCFLSPSGVEEFPSLSSEELLVVMKELAELDALLLVHAELPDALQAAPPGDPATYSTYLASRPARAEVEAVELLVDGVRSTGCRTHVLHLSAAGALEPLRGAREEGLPITAETCPHYLALQAEDVPASAASYKCAPPIRERANRERLWSGVRDGTIGIVVTDHSPCPAELKSGDFLAAWGGIASLQLGLPVVWTEAAGRGLRLEDVARWMSAGPASLAGLSRKGRIARGFDADLVIFRPDERWKVDPRRLHHRHPVTPYAGRSLTGLVAATYVRGALVYADGEFASAPTGTLLARTP